MPIGKVKNRAIKKNRDGSKNVLIIQTEVSDPDDLQSVELVTQAGEDYNPPDDSKLIVVELGPGFKVAVACDDGIEPSAAEGERRLYSISGGSVAAIIHLKADGQIVLNGGAGTAVEYSRLKTAFDQLKSDFDALVTFINGVPGVGHVHTDSVGGFTTAMSGTASTTTADMTPAESDTVNVP